MGALGDAAGWAGNAAEDTAGFVGDRAEDAVEGVASVGGFVAKTAQGGWDLATDPLEEIYAEARRGVAWLRDGLAEVADFAVHPVGDSASLRQSAGAWAAVVRALDAEGRSLTGAAPGLAGAWKGPNGDSYLDGVSAATSSMTDVEAAAREVQRLLERGADTIDDLNQQVQLLVAETLAWIGLSMVVGLITGGIGLVAGGARVALVVKKVKSLVATARSTLVALRVAQAVRLSSTGYKLRKTAELTRLGTSALSGARWAAKQSKAASATKIGRGVSKTRKALSPFSTNKRRLVFASSTASSAVSTSLAKDPKDWDEEDIARMVAGGYLTAVGGDKLTALLKKGKLGEVGASLVQSSIFGVTSSAGSQAAFNKGRVDWTEAGVTGLTGGAGGGLGRGSVRGRLNRLERIDTRGLSPAQKKHIDAQKERLKAAGRLGPEAIGEGAIQNRVEDLKARGASAGDERRRLVVPPTKFLDLPSAPVLHTIRPGESLSSIAGDRLDDPIVWRRIRQANPGLVDPDLIHPGDRVAIPRDLGFRVAG